MNTVGNKLPTQRAPVDIASALIEEIEGDTLFQQFRANLERRNIELTSPDISRVAWLSAAPGVAYRVGNNWMIVHLYPNVATAKENADRIPEGADSGLSDWVAPPHFFQCHRIIALYLGQDQKALNALTEICGEQFTGF